MLGLRLQPSVRLLLLHAYFKAMSEINGYFRVNPTPAGKWELAVYQKGFAPATLKDRKVIGLYQTEGKAYKAIEDVLVTIEK